MKARLLLGIAALAAPAMFATSAQAQQACSQQELRARNSTSLAEVQVILSQAGDCDEAILDKIRARRDELRNAQPDVTNTVLRFEQASTPPPAGAARPGVTEAPARREEEPAAAPSATVPEAQEISEPPPPPRPLEALVVGRPLSGARLETGDETFGELYYDQYTLQLEASQFIEIVVQAQDFTPIVAIGQGRAPDNFYDMADAFPESDTDQEARLRFLTPESGEYTILAASVLQYGTYSISVSPFEPPPPPRPTQIALDSETSGSFTADSPVLYEENSVSYALYSLSARAGEALQISMTTPDGSGIDPYLVIGRMGENGFEELDRNDDRGDGTLNSMLRFTPEQDGEYVIRARTFGAAQYGDYHVSAYRVATLTAPQALSRRAGAWARQGEISSETPILAGTEASNLPLRYVSYEFTPRSGRTYRVRAYSGDFEPIVDVVRVNRGETTPIDVYQKGTSSREPNDLSFEAGRGTYVVRVAAQPDQYGFFDIVIAETE